MVPAAESGCGGQCAPWYFAVRAGAFRRGRLSRGPATVQHVAPLGHEVRLFHPIVMARRPVAPYGWRGSRPEDRGAAVMSGGRGGKPRTRAKPVQTPTRKPGRSTSRSNFPAETAEVVTPPGATSRSRRATIAVPPADPTPGKDAALAE